MQIHDGDAARIVVRVAERCSHPWDERGELRARGRRGRSSGQAAEGECRLAGVEGRRTVDLQRQPCVDARLKRFEALRHDAHNPMWLTVHVHHAADRRGVAAKLRGPQRMADECDVSFPSLRFAGLERSAERWLDTECREEIGRDTRSVELARLARAGHRDSPTRAERRNRAERTRIRLEIFELGGGDRARGPHRDQSLRLGIRKWAQQHRGDHAVHGGVGADAERKGEQRDHGEGALAHSDTKRERGVLSEGIPPLASLHARLPLVCR
jgi:hypothetical protein